MKNNIGEAILISAVLFYYFYFRPTDSYSIFILIIAFILPLFTWSYISHTIRDKQNELEFRKLELEIEKLERELNK